MPFEKSNLRPVGGTAGKESYITDGLGPTKLLSILCQGRDDNYMGNFTWRLAAVLNNHARNLVTLGLEDEVEVLVTDWGSSAPLYRTLNLSEDARRLTSFIRVEPEVAHIYDKDAGYSGTHPINSAARRGCGEYFLFSDSDVLIPLNSMARLISCLRCRELDGLSLDEYFFWASRYHIPNEFVRKSPSMLELDNYIAANAHAFFYEGINKEYFQGGGVCKLMTRRMWFESTGWDEKLIYWGWYDIDWTKRLCWKYRWDLLELHGIKILHMEHYRDRFAPNSATKEIGRKVNTYLEPTVFAANTSDWGLADRDLAMTDGFGQRISPTARTCPSTALLRHDVSKPPQSALSITANYPLYRELGIIEAEPPRLKPPSFERVLKQLKPGQIAEIGPNLGDHMELLASSSFVQGIFCVDDWRAEKISAYYGQDGPLADALLNYPYEFFLGRVIQSGAQTKVFPIRLGSGEGAEYLMKQGLLFDMIYVRDRGRHPGARRDALRWLPLLSRFGVLCIESCTIQGAPTQFAPEVAEMLKKRRFSIIEEQGSVVFVPEQ